MIPTYEIVRSSFPTDSSPQIRRVRGVKASRLRARALQPAGVKAAILLAAMSALAIFSAPCSVAFSATSASASASVSSTGVSFGNQAVGTTSAAQAVTLSNIGNAALSITSVAITGTNASNFAQRNNCGRSLAVGTSCTISVTFKPTAAGTRKGTLSISDNAATRCQTVSLTGTGAMPAVKLSPTSVSLGNQSVGASSTAQPVTLTNSGSATLSITSLAITGLNATNFTQTNNCGSSVAAGGNCTISVTFRPTAAGTRKGTLNISDNAAGSRQTVSLTGTGAVPAAKLSPTSVSFGNQSVGATSTAQTATLSNTGNGALNITSLAITGLNATNFTQTNNCGSSVAAGGKCTISVTFTPSASGSRVASVSITDNASGSPQTVGLSGTATAPVDGLSPSSLSFGNQSVGATSTAQTATLSNTGNGALNITSLTITGTNAGDFAQTNTCGSSVAAGGKCTISVTFTPSGSGSRAASVSITDNASGSPQTVGLSGTGTAPVDGLSPSSLSFGNQSVGATSTAQTATLSNTGNGALNITSLTITGTNAGDFAQTNTCGSSVAAGGKCTISVTFTPSGSGSRAASVSIADNASGSPQTIGLSGTGTTAGGSIPASFVQAAASAASGTPSTLSLSFPANTTAGDLILVAFDYSSNVTSSSVSDSRGNVFTEVGDQLTSPGGALTGVYYAKNIKGGADTVTVTLSASSSFLELYLSEYSGVDPTNPIDAQAGASGSAGAVSSGTATTSVAGDIIYGYCLGDAACTVGSGFTARSTLNGNLLEDKVAGSAGSYAATGSATKGWTMQMVALKPDQSAVVAPPVITSATTASGTAGAAFSYQITATNTPTTYGATGLPAGLSVNTGTGLISGTPTSAGTSKVNLSATNPGGTGNATLTLTIAAAIPASFVQAAASASQAAPKTLSLAFPANTQAGDFLLVAFNHDTNATPSSVSDSQGNAFTEVGNQLSSPGGALSRVYYATNIKGGADTVTVTLSANSSYLEVYLSEYSGIDPTNPIDAQVGASGSAGAVSSGTATTSVAGDIIYGYCLGDAACTVGSGFTARSTLNGNLLEDMVAGSAGSYAATGSATNGWTMQMVALKPASATASDPPPVANLSPASLTFASQTVGTASSPQSVTLSNTGGAALSITNIAITGTNPSDFAQTNNCGSSVAVGANCTISVTFTPAASGSFTASLTLTDNAADSPQSITLTGTGTSSGGGTGASSPVAVVSPTSLVFASQSVSITSSAQTVTLTNGGNSILTIASLAITGANAGDFAEVADTCGSSVAAGGSCTIGVAFTPSAVGQRTATLSITDNASGSPQGVSLSGTGTHTVILSWGASQSSGVVGYNVYRGSASGGESSTPLNSTPINGTSYADANVTAGTNYYYVVTTVGSGGVQSAPSGETQASVPTP